MIERSGHKCLHCLKLFRPDHRNRRHQRYCGEPACRRASKAESQRRWLARPENVDYFRGADQVTRVQEWRRANPGYARGRRRKTTALQDVLTTQVVDSLKESSSLHPALQDLLDSQPLVLAGLIAHLTGAALQGDIVRTSSRLKQLALDLFPHGALHGAQATTSA